MAKSFRERIFNSCSSKTYLRLRVIKTIFDCDPRSHDSLVTTLIANSQCDLKIVISGDLFFGEIGDSARVVENARHHRFNCNESAFGSVHSGVYF